MPSAGNGQVVVYGEEFRRIEALPRRTEPVLRIDKLSAWLRTGAEPTATLLYDQAWALTELYDNASTGVGGIAGILPVGKGKTLITLLGGTVVNAKRPILLVPAGLKKKTDFEIPEYQKKWRIHTGLRVVSNQLLQTLNNKQLLFRYMPDWIFIDEAHEYKNKDAARTRRLIEYCERFPNTGVAILSGTLVKDSIKDYAHLLALVFPRKQYGERFWSMSPVPYYKSRELDDWCKALDERTPDQSRASPGALMRWCKEGQSPRQAFGERLYQTPGIIAPAYKEDCAASLDIVLRPTPPIPDNVRAAFAEMRRTGTTPAGDQLTDRFSVWRRFRELAYGFYYRWVWPSGRPDVEWLEIRRAWRKTIRHILKHNRRGLDSVKGVENAVAAGQFGREPLEEMNAWLEIKKRYPPSGKPPREAVWLSDYLLQDAAKFDSIIWVEHPEVGQKLSQLTGKPYFGAGDGGEISRLKGESCILSVHAHRKGHNLQDRYTEALYFCMPSNSEMWEQSVGRIHRRGQEADATTMHVYMHCLDLYEAFQGAISEALYIKDTTRQPQKVLTATKALLTPDEVIAKMRSGDALWSETA